MFDFFGFLAIVFGLFGDLFSAILTALGIGGA